LLFPWWIIKMFISIWHN